jgi:uncharacterized membrane protein YkoI
LPARVREAKCNAADPLRFRSWPELFLPQRKYNLGGIPSASSANMKTRLSTLFLLALMATAPLCTASKIAFAGSPGDDGGGDDKNGGGDDKNGGDDDDNGGGNGGGGGAQSPATNSRENETDHIQNAVKKGQAVSLSTLLTFIRATYNGTIINVDLQRRGKALIYQVKLLTAENKLKILRLDALSLTDPNTASIY